MFGWLSFDLGKAESSYYIAMEYVSGRNVQHLMVKQQSKGGSLPVEHVCRIIAGVCDGLHYAHSRKDYDGKPLNIIHRDISPQNVLVSFAGGVKVVDFGIAKASTQLAQTRAGVLKGKYAYMSPEQVRGAKIDHRSDLFAVGLVMYEMLTGQRAFERDSSLKTLKAIVQEKPLNPRELNPDVPMEVVKLLSKALEKNPDRRYKTAQEMQLAIEDFLESSPKKSNNVRLSRYMYELFDDELNSADGTMVVKGIGEVIIPTSQGEKPVPRVEEEIDHGTLSAALLPVAPGEKAEKAAETKHLGPPPRVEKGIDASKSNGLAGGKRPPPPPVAGNTGPQRGVSVLDDDHGPAGADDESDDGATIPAFDMEDYEKKRAAKANGAITSSDVAAGQAPSFDDLGDSKTVGGIAPSALIEPPKPERGRGRQPTSPGDDKRAAELLAKVDAMAGSLGPGPSRGGAADSMATAAGAPAASVPSSEGVRWDGKTGETTPKTGTLPDGPPGALKGLDPQPSMIIGPNGKVSGPVPAGVRPAARMAPGEGGLSGPSSSTLPSLQQVTPQTASLPSGGASGGSGYAPREQTGEQGGGPLSPAGASRGPASAMGGRRSAQAAAVAQGTPTLVLVTLGFIATMTLLTIVAVVMLAVFAKGGGEGVTVEYGLLTVTTEPAGATVIVDGEKDYAQTSPARLDVPVEGEHKVKIELDGKKPVEREFNFAAGTTSKSLHIKLE